MQLRGEKLQYSQEYTGDLNSSMCLLVFSRVVGISIDKKQFMLPDCIRIPYISILRILKITTAHGTITSLLCRIIKSHKINVSL